MADYWTDDKAPVEWITDRMVLSYGLSGKDLRRGAAAHCAVSGCAKPHSRIIIGV